MRPMLCIVTMTLKVVIQYATNVMYRDYDPQSSYPICDSNVMYRDYDTKSYCTKPMLCIVTQK